MIHEFLNYVAKENFLNISPDLMMFISGLCEITIILMYIERGLLQHSPLESDDSELNYLRM